MPAPGEIKHFPNGQVGRWDGQGWEKVSTENAVPPPPAPSSTGGESKNFLRSMMESRGLMSAGGAMGAGMLAAPFTEGMSIPLALGVEAIAGGLGGMLGAGGARIARNDPKDVPLSQDLSEGGIEGALTASGGSMMKAGARGMGAVGRIAGPWGRRSPGAALGYQLGGGTGGALGIGAGEAALNPKILPAAIEKTGEALRPSGIRSAAERLFSGGAPEASPGAAASGLDSATMDRLRKAGYSEDMIRNVGQRAAAQGPSSLGSAPRPGANPTSTATPAASEPSFWDSLKSGAESLWNKADDFMTKDISTPRSTEIPYQGKPTIPAARHYYDAIDQGMSRDAAVKVVPKGPERDVVEGLWRAGNQARWKQAGSAKELIDNAAAGDLQAQETLRLLRKGG